MHWDFFLGIALSLVAVFFYVTWNDWSDLPQHWRTEPDKNMRPWFVAIRRIFKGPMPPKEKE